MRNLRREANAREPPTRKPGWKSAFSEGEGDSIGWYCPLVPKPDNETFYPYPNVPEQAAKWWHDLPTTVSAS